MFKLRVQAWINVTRIIPTSCYPAHKMRTHTPTLISRFLNFSNQLLLNTKWSCERENEGTEYKFLPSGIRAASAPPDLLQHMRYLRGDPSRQLPATAWVSHRISAVGTEGRPWSPLVDKDGITAVSVSKRSQPVWDGSLPGLWSASVTWNPNQGQPAQNRLDLCLRNGAFVILRNIIPTDFRLEAQEGYGGFQIE